MLERIADTADLVHNIFMTDEDLSTWAVLLISKSLGISPIRILELSINNPPHEKNVTVWRAVSSFGIIAPYFFEDNYDNAVTVNSQRYVENLENFIIPELDKYQIDEETLFHQDGSTNHRARIAINTVNHVFPDRVISINGAIYYMTYQIPRSCSMWLFFVYS